MNTNVLVSANSETGECLTWRTIQNKNGDEREVAVLMLRQTGLNNSSIGGLSKRVAFKTIEKEVVDYLGEANIIEGMVWPQAGKLQIIETIKPYVSKAGKTQSPKVNPTTGEVITYQGNPVYRNTEFVADVNAVDVFLKDTPVEATDATE